MSDNFGFDGFDAKELDAFIQKLKNMSVKNATADRMVKFAAEKVLADMTDKVPVDFGDLRNSSYIKKTLNQKSDRNAYIVGFNKNYAKQMDTGFEKNVIRPVKAKALYIPITRKGKRTGPTKGGVRRLQASRTGGGAVAGRDFVFVKSVKAPSVKTYGSRSGPNRYFTGTMERLQRSPKKFLKRFEDAFIQHLRTQAGQ